MKARARVAVLILSGLILWVNASAVAEDVQLQAAGPIGLAYVGMYYGLTDLSDKWYVAENLVGSPSTTWHALVDTGASATILGRTTQAAYAAGTAIPMQPYPDVKFSDVGFGGAVDFAVTQSVQVMLAGQKAAEGDTENHSLYTVHTPAMTLAAARSHIGGGAIDFDIIGTSILQGQVLRVDPHSLEVLRQMLPMLTMSGSLGQSPPLARDGVFYVPMTMQDFCPGTPSVDVGEHPMVPIHVRKDASDPFAVQSALFDTGSPVNFISASFAADAGIDLENDTPFDTIPISGIGGGQTECPGYYVDALALELGAGRGGDKLVISKTAVFVISDAEMPGGLKAILGNGIFSHSSEGIKTTVVEWYVDMRDGSENLIIVIPEPGSAILMLLGAVAIIRRRVNRRR